MNINAMENKILYGKRTIILFIVISVVLLGYSLYTTYMMAGAGWIGIPFTVYSWGDAGGPPAEPVSGFSLINLILDLLVYYVIALIISFGISKIKK